MNKKFIYDLILLILLSPFLIFVIIIVFIDDCLIDFSYILNGLERKGKTKLQKLFEEEKK